MRPTLALRAFRPTARMMRPVPVSAGHPEAPDWSSSPANLAAIQKEDQAVIDKFTKGHTVSQRLRKLKQIPAELYPLFVVVGFALGAAAYSTTRKFFVDKNLRLARQGAAARAAQNSDGHGGEH
ncbi:uncharacterized protein Triagg1_6525 [Trichoderma aggressivum f. europaeum]|uniref:Uncharacterized protein n=1 Tax=Trichoderma aggressivum f. europaeum TaxID=173218 RepID=A0AAE1M3S7_9HYPO|nr:hypothetical protein Triagg1_6525 [Trichoderma aggressivum f. europaeum]